MSADNRSKFPRSAWKRLEKTRASRAGWDHSHYDKMLQGFGFEVREGRHSNYIDAQDRDNFVSVPRGKNLGHYVGDQAIEAIETVIRREGEDPSGQQ